MMIIKSFIIRQQISNEKIFRSPLQIKDEELFFLTENNKVLSQS